MRNIWIISDTHFNHHSVLDFENYAGKKIRPEFSTIKEMNECIIDNWNAVVKEQDIIYHLGDVYFGAITEAQTIMKSLNGRKRLVVGNHDDIKLIIKYNLFQKITLWRMFPEYGVVLTHLPMDKQSLLGKDLINVHGHIHRNYPPTEKHRNVSVEWVNYTPVNIEEVI